MFKYSANCSFDSSRPLPAVSVIIVPFLSVRKYLSPSLVAPLLAPLPIPTIKVLPSAAPSSIVNFELTWHIDNKDFDLPYEFAKNSVVL